MKAGITEVIKRVLRCRDCDFTAPDDSVAEWRAQHHNRTTGHLVEIETVSVKSWYRLNMEAP